MPAPAEREGLPLVKGEAAAAQAHPAKLAERVRRAHRGAAVPAPRLGGPGPSTGPSFSSSSLWLRRGASACSVTRTGCCAPTSGPPLRRRCSRPSVRPHRGRAVLLTSPTSPPLHTCTGRESLMYRRLRQPVTREHGGDPVDRWGWEGDSAGGGAATGGPAAYCTRGGEPL